MRPELVALACPKKNAATMLMTSPMKVRALGEILVRARPCTIRSKSQPQARPKALVQVILASLLLCAGIGLFFVGHFIMDCGQFQNLEFAFAVGSDDSGDVATLLAYNSATDGRCCRNESLGHIRFFAGHKAVDDLFVLGGVKDDNR